MKGQKKPFNTSALGDIPHGVRARKTIKLRAIQTCHDLNAMSSPDHDGLIRQLLARQTELERLIDMLRGSAVSGGDAAAVRIEDNDLIDSVGNEVTGELLLLRATLERLNDGSYGICGRCESGISEERLRNYVYASLCSACANQAGGESGEKVAV